jgi:hypothetical protein
MVAPAAGAAAAVVLEEPFLAPASLGALFVGSSSSSKKKS